MGDIWQEHRRFIVIVAGGGLGFLVLWLVVGAIFGGDVRQRERIIAAAKRDQALALPAGVSLSAVQRQRADLEARFEDLTKEIHRVPDSGYALPANEPSADNYFGLKVDELRRDFIERCAIRDIDVDNTLGLPRQTPATRAEIDWYLRGLDVVRQVVGEILLTDADLTGGIARVSRIEIAKAPKGQKAEAAKFLSEIPVEFEIVGHPAALDRVLRAISAKNPGRHLVTRAARMTSLDLPPGQVESRRDVDPRDRSRVALRITWSAVFVDATAPVVAGRR